MNEQMQLVARVDASAKALQARFGAPPAAAIVLGSGLGVMLEALEVIDRCPYRELGLPETSTFSHAGELVLVRAGGAPLAVLSGRVHYYEGHTIEEVVAAVRGVARWGVGRVVMTNAVGGIVPEWSPGEMVLIQDHINQMGVNPLRGPGAALAPLGPRFPDMGAAYDPALRAEIRAAASGIGVPLQEGVLVSVPGPSFETPAEIVALRRMGAHVVGMSTVPEVIALKHMGTPAAAISVVTNHAAGVVEGPVDHAAVVDASRQASGPLRRLISSLNRGWSGA